MRYSWASGKCQWIYRIGCKTVKLCAGHSHHTVVAEGLNLGPFVGFQGGESLEGKARAEGKIPTGTERR